MKNSFLRIEAERDSYIKSRFGLRLLFNGYNCNWHFFYYDFFLLNLNNVRAFSFSIITIAIKRVLHKAPEGEKSALLVADYIPAMGRDSRRSFSADLTNVRTRISDGRIQFHRDVISVFSANYITRASRPLYLVYMEIYCNLQQPPAQKI